MAGSVPAIKNAAYTFAVGLTSQADVKLLQANPTLAAGDVKVDIDGAGFNNLTSLPTVTPAAGRRVQVALTADEMNGDIITVQFVDAAGAEWCDLLYIIYTQARGINDLAYPQTSGRGTLVAADGSVSPNWADVKSPTTTVNLSGTTVKTATDIATQITALNNLSSAQVASLLTATIADSIPADGTRPSIASGILMLTRFIMERSVSGATVTAFKEDGSTASMTFTLNDATTPTSITRTT
jgi:hypothetical protein